MKRLIIIMLGLVFTTGAMAQTKKVEEKDLKKTIEAKKDEKKEVGNDLKHLKVGQAVEDRKDVRAIRKNEHRKAKHLKKAHGVKNPVHKAEKEIREEKKN